MIFKIFRYKGREGRGHPLMKVWMIIRGIKEKGRHRPEGTQESRKLHLKWRKLKRQALGSVEEQRRKRNFEGVLELPHQGSQHTMVPYQLSRALPSLLRTWTFRFWSSKKNVWTPSCRHYKRATHHKFKLLKIWTRYCIQINMITVVMSFKKKTKSL